MRRPSLSSHFRSWPWLCLSRLFLAAAASLLCWISLGCLGTCVAGQPRPANNVLSLVGQGRIRLGTPLRWHGHLCDEPARLPWGYTNELCADVLKIGHHGRKNSTMPEFLGAVQPRVGIASSGEANPYGHPSPKLLERLGKAGVGVFRMDHDGAVHVLTDGMRLKIACFVACPEAGSVMGSSMRAEIPNQKQDGEKK